ncbi:hypothetical protein DRQ26_03040 [bacterium]|nr:MAG: hypothetical protein DRQ26_03040 [bacterium]
MFNLETSSLETKKESGFTLIELLISTVILTSLIYLAALSYSLFLRIWKQGGIIADTAVNRYRTDILIRSSLESIYDYYVTDPANERAGLYYPFFKGDQDGVEFITLSSVFLKGSPAVARLGIKRTNNSKEKHFEIVYEETPLRDLYVRYNDFSGDYRYSMVVYNDVKDFKPRYFGVWEEKHGFKRHGGLARTLYKWQSSFYGKEKRSIPREIEFTVLRQDIHETLHYSIRTGNIFKTAFFRREF